MRRSIRCTSVSCSLKTRNFAVRFSIYNIKGIEQKSTIFSFLVFLQTERSDDATGKPTAHNLGR